MKSDIIMDMAGRPVDCSTQEWRLNTAGSPIVLDWGRLARLPEPVLNAAREYARSRIPLCSPPTVGGLFYMYQLLAECPYFDRAFEGTVSLRAFEELRADSRAGSSVLIRYRIWCQWAATLELPGFDPSVSRVLRGITIGANPQGRPARNKDPEQGPLTDRERQDLFDATLDALDEELPLVERVAILLSMGLGANSGPLSLLQIQDYEVKSAGGTTYHLLRVPRHKKGFAKERADFRVRQIDGRWAPYVEKLIEQNRAAADELYVRSMGRLRPENVAIPLFMRAEIRQDLTPSMAEYALHLMPLEFTQLLHTASERLDARSRDGGPLRLNARRLRSTFATNLIADGKSTRVVAHALDHLSTKWVDKYALLGHRLVPSLDARVGDTIEAVAGAFLGTLAEKSSEAARNRQPSSRVSFLDRERHRPEELGNCGSGACELVAPLACYTCRAFEPWIDAPHQRLLGQLKADRERRESSRMHPRIVAVQDRTIEAVVDVVEKIKAMNARSIEARSR